MAPIPPEIERRVGTVIAGRYTLLRVLGVGGMGAVFEAEQSLLARRVALKVMLRETELGSVAAERFLQEAQAAARVVHPNVVAVLDVGHDAMNQTLSLVHEYLTGVDLRQRLTDGPLAPREALELLVPVIAALAALHRRGIVHRDIKPENIFFAETDGRVIVPKLIDFGVSKLLDEPGEPRSLTRTGHLVGTPQYMSPEQARGERRIDAATDVWAIGVVLYEALSGRCPFVADNYNALMLAILTEEPPRLDALAPAVPASLAQVIHGALARDRASRPAAADLLASLLACEGVSTEAWRARLAATYESVAARSEPPAVTPSDPLSAPTMDPAAPSSTPSPAPADLMGVASTLGARPPFAAGAVARRETVSRRILLGAVSFAIVTLGAIGWRASSHRASAVTPVREVPRAPLTVIDAASEEAPTGDALTLDATTASAAASAAARDAGDDLDAGASPSAVRERPDARTRALPRPRPRPTNGIPII
ncbi:MAG: serine/threonine-protein kinase [Polyangiales bacterium]